MSGLAVSQCSNLRSREGPLMRTLYALTIFLSAFLLFQVQLILGKYFLPWFGGTPAMWITCTFFFQSLLVLGYFYAHGCARLNVPSQGRLHAIVLLCALLVTAVSGIRWHSPLFPDASWRPIGSDYPVAHLVLILTVSVGVPYFALSATGPLLQSWFAHSHPASSPYRLYGLSNLGSFVALLSYPFAVEPWLRLQIQARLWIGGFCVFVASCIICALRQRHDLSSSPKSTHGDVQHGPSLGRRLGEPILWLSLAACGSLLFLATTNEICQNIAVIPLLWTLPLSIYLLTLVICFEKPNWYLRALFHPAFLIALGVAVFVLNGGALTHLPLQIACYAVILFVSCMVCHGELVRAKPPAEQLTLFYLMTSIGGATAGLFVVVIAQRLFTAFVEYPIGLWLTAALMLLALVRDRNSWIYAKKSGVPAVALGAAVFPGIIALLVYHKASLDYAGLLLLLTLAVYIVSGKTAKGFSTAKRTAAILFSAFALLLLSAILIFTVRLETQNVVSAARSFYGVLTVREINRGDAEWGGYRLSHGRISMDFNFGNRPKIFCRPAITARKVAWAGPSRFLERIVEPTLQSQPSLRCHRFRGGDYCGLRTGWRLHSFLRDQS
jgi:hypothetical protein